MALNDYALRFVASRQHKVTFGDYARKHSSLRGCDRFTWEAWVKVGAGATSPNQRAYFESQTENKKIRFACAPTREGNRSILRFELAREDGNSPTAYTFVLPQAWDDRWHHVAFSANIGDREYMIYYDGVGVLKGTLANAGKKKKDSESQEEPLKVGGSIEKETIDGEEVDGTEKYIPAHIWVGAGPGSGGDGTVYWDGKIDNIRIWKTSKSGSTFGQEMYDQTDNYASDSNLIEEWRFNDGPGTSSSGAVSPDGWVAGTWLSTTTKGAVATVTASDGLNLRSSPSATGGVITTLAYGASVYLCGGSQVADGYTWYQVAKVSGWVAGDWLSTRTKGTTAYVTATDGLNLRSGPGTGYASLQLLSYNTQVYVAGPSATADGYTWYQVITFGTPGAGRGTVGVKDNSNTATLSAKSGDHNELWIGRDTQTDFTTDGYLGHDYDRPYLGAGLYDNTPPTPPTNLQVVPGSITNDSFRISWTASEDDVYVQRYEVDVATDRAFSNTLPDYTNRSVGRNTELSVIGLQEGATYYWRVRAIDSSNNDSDWVSTTALRGYTLGDDSYVNLSTNPSFEDGTSNWYGVADTGRVPELIREEYQTSDNRPAVAYSEAEGSYYLRVSNAATGSVLGSGVAHSIAWKKAIPLICSFYVRGTGAIQAVVIPRKNFVTLKDTDNNTEPVTLNWEGGSGKQLVLDATTWRRVWFTGNPYPSGVMDNVELRILSTGGDGAFYQIDIDCVLIEKGYSLRPFFDGSSTSNTYWATETDTNKNGYIVEPDAANNFGYVGRSPSVINPGVIREAQGVRTLQTYDRPAPGIPNVDRAKLEDGIERTETAFIAIWDAAATNYENVIGYELDVSTNENFLSPTTIWLPGYYHLRLGNVLSRAVVDLKPKTTYYYRVRSYDDRYIYSGWSETVAVATLAQVDTDPPQEVVLLEPTEVTFNSFVANWQASFDYVGVEKYVLTVALGSPDNVVLTKELAATELSYNMTDLAQGTSYYYWVQAADAAGNITQGLSYSGDLKDYDPATYRVARTLTRLAADGGDLLVEYPLPSMATINTTTGVANAADVTNWSLAVPMTTSKKLYVNAVVQGTIGSVTNASLYLYREMPLAAATATLSAKLKKSSDTTQTAAYAAATAQPIKMPPVTVTVTALTLPTVTGAERFTPLFDPLTLTVLNAPEMDTTPEKTVSGTWDRDVFVIDVTPLISQGLRAYGFVITVDGDVRIHTTRSADVNLHPRLVIRTNETDALSLSNNTITAEPYTAFNIFPNPTFDNVDAAVPLFNSSFDRASVDGWSLWQKPGSGVDAVFEYSAASWDKIGGSGKLRIKTHPITSMASSTERLLHITMDRRFSVNSKATYTVSAMVATEYRDLPLRVGIVWFDSLNGATKISEEFSPIVRPVRAGAFERVELANAVPPSTAKYGRVTLYPHPLGDDFLNDPYRTVVYVDAIELVADNGDQPVFVNAATGITVTRVSDEADAFMQGPNLTDSVVRLAMGSDQQQVRLLGPVDQRLPWLSDAITDAVVNVFENPSFESAYGLNDSTKYSPTGNAILSRSRDFARSGSYALKAEFPNRAVAGGLLLRSARFDDKLSGAYLATFWYRGTGTYTAKLQAKYSDSATLVSGSTQTFTAVSTDWSVTAVKVGLSLDSTRTLEYLAIAVDTSGATPTTSVLYLDNVQIEAAVTATSAAHLYCDGHQAATQGRWDGPQDRSISHRAAFVATARVRSTSFDPALEYWTEMVYTDEINSTPVVYRSPKRTMPVLARWDNNMLADPSYSGTLSDNWSTPLISGVTRYVSKNTAVYYGRLGADDRRSLQFQITANSKSNQIVSSAESKGSDFFTVGGQTVTAYVMGRSTSVQLAPTMAISFYALSGTTAQLLSTVQMPAPTVKENCWYPLKFSATAPDGAQFCRVSLQAHAWAPTPGSVYFSSVWAGFDRQEVEQNWTPIVSFPVAPLSEYLGSLKLASVDLVFAGSAAVPVTVDVDAAAIKFNSTDVTTFNGATMVSDWIDRPFASGSEMYSADIVNRTYYAGDADESATISTGIKPRGWTRYDYPDAADTEYTRDRRFVTTVIPSILRWNELSNGSFFTTKGWSVTNNSTLQAATPVSSTQRGRVGVWTIGTVDTAPRLTCTEVLRATEGERWAASINVRVQKAQRTAMTDPLGGQLMIKFFDKNGVWLSNVPGTAIQRFEASISDEWETVEAATIAPKNAAWVRLEIAPYIESYKQSLQAGDVVEVSRAMLYRGAAGRSYVDGSDASLQVFWEGVPYASPSIFVLQPQETYNLLTLPEDEDGIMSAFQYLESKLVMPPAPSLFVRYRFDRAEIEPGDESLTITIPFDGTDEDAAQVVAQIRRADRFDRVDAEVGVVGNRHEVVITKGGLAPNTDYVVEVFISAPNGRLRGEQQHYFTVKTGQSPVEERERPDGTVSYGGFVLNGSRSTYYWVTRHDAFSLPARRMQIEQLPRADGAVEMQSYWDRKTVTMEGGVWGEDRKQLEAHLRDLRAALSKTKQELRIDTLSNANTYYTATCSSFNITESGGEALTGLTWSATFECSDPFLYKGEETVYEFTIASSGSLLAAEELLGSDQVLTVTNNGSVYALPKITIASNTSAGTYATALYNDKTGDRFVPKDYLSTGEFILMDSKTKQCQKQGGTKTDYSGSFLQLAPGDNKLRVSIRPLSQQRHNLLENPSADDLFVKADGANIYPTYSVPGSALGGIAVSQVRTLTYNASPYAAMVVCDGIAANQGVVLRTPKSLGDKQGWDSTTKRSFVASAVVRTDDISRKWMLNECFVRIWYTDGKYTDYTTTSESFTTVSVGSTWNVLTTPAITSLADKIDYVELILRSPVTETGSQAQLPVTFYVDDCKLIETAIGKISTDVNFTVKVAFRERFI